MVRNSGLCKYGGMKINYITIPFVALAVSFCGSLVTTQGMDWYKSLNLPGFTPPGALIGAVWTVIFILTAISALIFWNKKVHDKNRKLIIALFVANAALNLLWSVLFFGFHLIGWSIIEMFALNLTTFGLIMFLWQNYLASSLLLFPYLAWVTFATYLAYSVYALQV